MRMKKLIILTFIFSLLAMPITLRAGANTTYITSARVNFRAEASLDAHVFEILPEGLELNMIHFDPDGWSRVRLGGTEGYVNSEFIVRETQLLAETIANEPRTEENPITEEPPLYSPDQNAQSLLELPDVVAAATVISDTAVEIRDSAPEENREIITQQDDNILYITTARVNFREQASFSGDIFEVVAAGLVLDIISYDPLGWSRVRIDGKVGYINSEFIARRDTRAVGEDFSVLNSRVENVHWSELKDNLPMHVPIDVLDIRTGLHYQVISFSNGSHADVVPLTQHDTDILLQTFGGSWVWTQRPVWVSVNGRTFAASINGMPHGAQSPTENNNGMTGHICLHFFGSRPHNGNASFERDNQNTVAEAWNARLR